MWKNVIETVTQSNRGHQGGCILAHCMGLGKTLQVHTILCDSNEVVRCNIVLGAC